jgi:hypothetical protein
MFLIIALYCNRQANHIKKLCSKMQSSSVLPAQQVVKITGAVLQNFTSNSYLKKKMVGNSRIKL